MKPSSRTLAIIAVCLVAICLGWLLTHSKKRHHHEGERHHPAAASSPSS